MEEEFDNIIEELFRLFLSEEPGFEHLSSEDAVVDCEETFDEDQMSEIFANNHQLINGCPPYMPPGYAQTASPASPELAIISVRKPQIPAYRKPKKLPHSPVTISDEEGNNIEVISCYDSSETETEDENNGRDSCDQIIQEEDKEEMVVDSESDGENSCIEIPQEESTENTEEYPCGLFEVLEEIEQKDKASKITSETSSGSTVSTIIVESDHIDDGEGSQESKGGDSNMNSEFQEEEADTDVPFSSKKTDTAEAEDGDLQDEEITHENQRTKSPIEYMAISSRRVEIPQRFLRKRTSEPKNIWRPYEEISSLPEKNPKKRSKLSTYAVLSASNNNIDEEMPRSSKDIHPSDS